MIRIRRRLARFLRQDRGSLAVELAIILPFLLILVCGIVDFGHAWYMEHVMSNASREGARLATKYDTNALGTRKLPSALTSAIITYVTGLVPYSPTVTVTGPALTITEPTLVAGKDLTVSVAARKNWFFLGTLIPGFGTYKDLQVATTMKCE